MTLIDKFTRECLAIRVAWRINGMGVIEVRCASQDRPNPKGHTDKRDEYTTQNCEIASNGAPPYGI